MEIIKPNKELLAKEKEEDEKRKLEDEKRREYFEFLKKDERFKRYVVEEILEANLNILTDVRNIKGSHLKDGFEEMGRTMFASMLARQTLEKILSKLKA